MKFLKFTGYYGREQFAADVSRIVYIQRIVKVETGEEFTRLWLDGQEDSIDVVEKPEYIDGNLILNIVAKAGDDLFEEEDSE
jgi:hypothetical protein